MGGFDYTQWSMLKTLNIYNIATPAGAMDMQFPLNFHDTWRFSAAANYKGIEKWVLRSRCGCYDQDSSDHRVLSADNVATTNVFLLGLGARYFYTKAISIDMAVWTLFLREN